MRLPWEMGLSEQLTTIIDVSGYPPGVYVLSYEEGGQVVATKKVVVAR